MANGNDNRQKRNVFQEERFQQDMRLFVDSFQLKEADKNQMWKSICNRKVTKTSSSIKRSLVTAAVLFACVLILGIGTNAATNGRITELIREVCGMEPDSAQNMEQEGTQNIEPESAQVIENRTPESEVFAPPLLFCDETRLIFANSRGMVIYNRTKEKVTATVDLQEIDCYYFTAHSLATRILVEGNSVVVFNEKNKAVQGKAYVFEMAESDEPDTVLNLKPVEIKKDSSLAKKWQKTMKKCYVDTFKHVDKATICAWQEGKADAAQYSEQSVLWTSEQGEHYMSCLLIEKGSYKLYTVNTETGKADTRQLVTAVPETVSEQTEKENTLPRYQYTGKDMKMKAICDYLVEHEQETDEEEFPVIPAPVFYEIVKEDGVWKVFGNFWCFSYYKNGNTLEEKGGSAMSACFHLKKKDGAYKVVKVERTGDGAEYGKGIEKFCQGHPSIYKKYFEDHKKQEKRIRKKLLRQYVKDNGLDITQYHEYGWDPVKLFPEK